GANCQSQLLMGMANALAASGFAILRFDLPFRQARPHGPPFPAAAERDRDGIRRAVEAIRTKATGRVFVGGHSYGGRQATILASEEPGLVDGLLLLSYPLHPPRKPEQLRTSHFPKLTTPAFFVHGTRDPFGTITEMNSALQLIPGPHALFEIPSAGHELLPKRDGSEMLADVVRGFQAFLER
ncbi:MAG: alpha/beta fold hydrolase, partial [Candidatus Acidiferrum sp.]